MSRDSCMNPQLPPLLSWAYKMPCALWTTSCLTYTAHRPGVPQKVSFHTLGSAFRKLLTTSISQHEDEKKPWNDAEQWDTVKWVMRYSLGPSQDTPSMIFFPAVLFRSLQRGKRVLVKMLFHGNVLNSAMFSEEKGKTLWQCCYTLSHLFAFVLRTRF